MGGRREDKCVPEPLTRWEQQIKSIWRHGYYEGIIELMATYVEEEEKTDRECWVGFHKDMDREHDKIPLTYVEAEAAKWILMGWDVGYLAGGLNAAENVKWLT